MSADSSQLPCRRGHVGGRYSNGKCRECVSASYMRRREAIRFKTLGVHPTRPCPSRCELCGGPPTGRWPRLQLDHDHQTKAFRGWLCSCCNRGIALLGDTLASVERAALYLRHPIRNGTDT